MMSLNLQGSLAHLPLRPLRCMWLQWRTQMRSLMRMMTLRRLPGRSRSRAQAAVARQGLLPSPLVEPHPMLRPLGPGPLLGGADLAVQDGLASQQLRDLLQSQGPWLRPLRRSADLCSFALAIWHSLRFVPHAMIHFSWRFSSKLTASVRRWHFQLHTAHTAQFRGACNALQDKAFADGGLDPISDDSDDDKPLGRRMTKPIA